MLFNWNKPGCSPYDPYLIKVCKNAIIKEKKRKRKRNRNRRNKNIKGRKKNKNTRKKI